MGSLYKIKEEEETMKQEAGLIKANVDPLTLRYFELKEVRGIPEIELLQYDVTELVYETIKFRTDHQQLMNMTIRGQVTGGKSTVGIHLMYNHNRYLVQSGRQPVALPIQEFILSDNSEYLRFADKDYTNVALLIDEYNTMTETGLSATTEMKLYDYNSDVFAQKMRHRYTCTPTLIVDKNSDLILETIGQNKEEETTICKVIYRDTIYGNLCLLGTARIKISDVIHTEWYKAYRKKKFYRMDLLEKRGITSIKEFEWAQISRDVFAKLSTYARHKKIPAERISGFIEVAREAKNRYYSILTLPTLITRVKAMLDFVTDQYKLKEDLNEMGINVDKPEEIDKGTLTEKQNDLVDMYIMSKELLGELINREEKICQTYEEYKKIMQ